MWGSCGVLVFRKLLSTALTPPAGAALKPPAAELYQRRWKGGRGSQVEKLKLRKDTASAAQIERNTFSGFSLKDDPLGVSKLLMEEAQARVNVSKKKYGGLDENMFDLEPIEKKLREEITQLKKQFEKIQVGRPAPKMFDEIPIDISGTISASNGVTDGFVPLTDLAQITVKSSLEVLIQAFKIEHVGAITKGLIATNKQWRPVSVGNGLLQLSLPKLTREKREEAVRAAQETYNEMIIIMRDICTDVAADIREQVKSKDWGIRETKRLKEVERSFLDDAKSHLQKKTKALMKED